ncbi:LacI family DNA-binding transcriptional regulator [Longitalea arenae]|uniref:LacI family DNA-binding transcriptional regulator n=1 Tax=Longitalea arenae TaxID=2812558 RepID=UPI0019674E3E|nr:LacI family DNA-binding transcriptional regulator [Longitalea arenae]
MKKKVSIHDIAKQLNVSAATVSFVLNGKAAEKRISEEMEQKILKHVNLLGYRPNRIAKSLRTGKSKIIGMLVEGIADPFFSAIARIIEEQAYKLDYKIFYASTENDSRITRNIIGAFRDTQVDGYIIVPPPGIEDDIQALMDDNFPVVLFDRYFPGLATCNIVVDNFDGVYQAMRHFLQHNYKNIGLVTIPSSQTQMRDRLNGYHHAITESGRTPYVKTIAFDLKPDQEKISHEIKLFLQEHRQIDAILFATNYLAISGLEAIKQLGKSVPRDIAVIGFDDNTHFSLFSPSITAVAQPIREISEHIMQQLMACLTGHEKAPEKKTTVLQTKLIIRESSQKQ